MGNKELYRFTLTNNKQIYLTAGLLSVVAGCGMAERGRGGDRHLVRMSELVRSSHHPLDRHTLHLHTPPDPARSLVVRRRRKRKPARHCIPPTCFALSIPVK